MFQFVNYSLLGDNTALDFTPSAVTDIQTTTIKNAIFDHVNVSRATNLPVSTAKPEEWDYDTIINAPLDGNLNGGNVEALVENITAIKVKRRVKGSFDWITLKVIPVNSPADLTFALTDWLNAYDVEYEYAFVLMQENIESNYIINSIVSKFDGVFIGDATAMYRLMYDVGYGTTTRNQSVGVFTPLGRQYPVVIANGLLNYDSGSVEATILNDSFDDSGVVDRVAISHKIADIKKFFANHKPKILKDWNGNIWLCCLVDNPQVNYLDGTTGGVPHVTINWTQIGDATDKEDLFNNGLIDEV